MINIFSIIFSFLFCMFLTISFIPIAHKLGRNLNIIDFPDKKRKIHQKPLPRTAGIAIALSVILTFFFFPKEKIIYYLIPFSLLFFTIGFVDDTGIKIRNIYKWLIGAGIVLIFSILTPFKIQELGNLMGFGKISMNFVISLIFSIFAINCVVHSFNLIDGIDGLAGGVSFLAGLSFAFLNFRNSDFYLACVSAGIAGASLGFLFYNFYPAKIFLGDAGSFFLGAMITGISVFSAKTGYGGVKPIQAVLILSLPISDMMWTVLRRGFTTKNIFDSDLTHLHYRVFKKIKSQRKTVVLLLALSVLFSLEAIFLENLPDYILFLIFWINFFIVGFLDKIFK